VVDVSPCTIGLPWCLDNCLFDLLGREYFAPRRSSFSRRPRNALHFRQQQPEATEDRTNTLSPGSIRHEDRFSSGAPFR